MPAFTRVEAWNGLECAGGTRQALRLSALSVTERRQLDGDDQLQVTLAINDATTGHVVHRGVIRTVFDDGAFDEWRIASISRTREVRKRTLDVTCLPVHRELNDACLIRRVESNGALVHQFGAPGLTIAYHLATYILPSLAFEGQAFWTAGTIEADAPIPAFVYDWDTPLGALRRLLGDTHELQVRRVGTMGYAIDALTQRGSTAPTVVARLGKNLKGLDRTLSSAAQVTRLYPSGDTSEDGLRASMAEALWTVVSVNGGTLKVVLADDAGGPPPFAFDDQLNWNAGDPIYLRPVGGTLTKVTDTIAAEDAVVVESVAGITAGDRIRFRRGNLTVTGQHLTFLESPLDRIASGLKVARLDRPDLPPTNNLVANAAQRTWPSGTLPTGWTAVGSVTTAKNTNAAYTRVGAQSIHLTTGGQSTGVRVIVPVSPDTVHPNVSGFIDYWLVSGRVRFEMWFSDGVTTTIRPLGDTKAFDNTTGVWSNLAIQFGRGEALALGATSISVVILQDGATAAELYVDDAQLTQTSVQQPFSEGCGATALWQATNDRLIVYAPPAVEIRGDLLDFERADPAAFPTDALVIGGRMRLLDTELSADVTTRVIGYTRDHRKRLMTAVQLSNRPQDLTDAIARPTRPAALPRAGTVTAIPTVTLYPDEDPAVVGSVRYQLGATPPDARIYYLILDVGVAPPPIGDAAWALYVGRSSIPASTDPAVLHAYCRIGSTTSSVYSWKLDTNGAADITGSLSELSGGWMDINWVPDGDTTRVDVYVKKTLSGVTLLGSGLPTTDGTTATATDPAAFYGYRDVAAGGRGELAGSPVTQIGAGTAVTLTGLATGDTIGVVLVPHDRRGRLGSRVTLTRTMAGAVSKRLATLAVAAVAVDGGTGADSLPVSWTVGAGVGAGESLDVDFSVNGGDYTAGVTITDPATTTSVSVATGLTHATAKFSPLASFMVRGTLRTGATVQSALTAGPVEDTVASLAL